MDRQTFKIIYSDELDVAYLDDQTEHYLQSSDWCMSNHDCYYAVSYTNEAVVAKSALRIKQLPYKLGHICNIDRGPSAINSEALAKHNNDVINFLSKKGIVYVQISPLQYGDADVNSVRKLLLQTGWTEISETLSLYKHTLVVDLLPEMSEIKSTFRRSLKTQLNKSEKLGIRIEFNPGVDEIDNFIQQHNIMARQRGIEVITGSIRSYILKAHKSGQIQILIAYISDDMISGVVLVKQNDRVIYEWGMTTQDEKYRTYPLAHKMHWEAIQWSKINGFKHYDMGGYWFDKGGDDPINYFKLGFTKNIVAVTPEFYYVLKPIRFYIINLMKQLRKITKR